MQSHITQLIDDLLSEDWMQRWTAARELVEVGKPAVPVLLDALNDPEVDKMVARVVIWMLGEIRDNRAISALAAIRIKTHEKAQKQLPDSAMLALAKFGTDAGKQLMDALMARNVDERTAYDIARLLAATN